MVNQIENRMVNDSVWENLEKSIPDEVEKKSNGSGYVEMGTRIFVSDEDAYDYALERLSQDEDLKQEFVEWLYSGNWIKED